MLSLEDQLRWIYAWTQYLNQTTDFPVVYAGHDTDCYGLHIRFFSLKERENLYGEVSVGWHDVMEDASRLGLADVRKEVGY